VYMSHNVSSSCVKICPSFYSILFIITHLKIVQDFSSLSQVVLELRNFKDGKYQVSEKLV
jgi:hypothetical protein